jgi:hypothetical protein
MAHVVTNQNCMMVFEYSECQIYHKNAFRLDVLVSIIIFLTISRFIMSLRVSINYGPLLKMLSVMTRSLVVFMFIWVLIIMLFSFTSLILFGDFEFARGPYIDVLSLFLQGTFGEVEFEAYET